jgi:acetyltransferase-like isoleucine patch superfamily enzyme
MRKLFGFLFKIFKKMMTAFNLLYNMFFFKVMKVRVTDNPNINGRVFIRNKGVIEIAKHCIINSNFESNPIGGGYFTSMIVSDTGRISIGENVGISNSYFYSKSSIHIGSNVMIGSGCRVYDTDFHSINLNERLLPSDGGVSRPVVIEDGAFIGGSSIILKGVTIGQNAVIGAGSVVTKSIPNNQVWAGNPARFIKSL